MQGQQSNLKHLKEKNAGFTKYEDEKKFTEITISTKCLMTKKSEMQKFKF